MAKVKPKSRFVLTIIDWAALCGGYGIALNNRSERYPHWLISSMHHCWLCGYISIIHLIFNYYIGRCREEKVTLSQRSFSVSVVYFIDEEQCSILAKVLAVPWVLVLLSLISYEIIHSNIQKMEIALSHSRDYLTKCYCCIWEWNQRIRKSRKTEWVRPAR